MITETDGIILRQVKLPGERRMMIVLTRRFGKISAGTNIQSNGKKKSSLALRSFTHGSYEIYHGRESFHINSAETTESFFRIGEDVDKYLCASYALEFTEKVLSEEEPAERILDLMLDFFRLLSVRKTHLHSLVIIYLWKLVQLCGYMPGLRDCARCGEKEIADRCAGLSVVDGGLICGNCARSGRVNLQLLYPMRLDIIRTLDYIRVCDFKTLGRLALKDEMAKKLSAVLKDYAAYHLGINTLKSASYLDI